MLASKLALPQPAGPKLSQQSPDRLAATTSPLSLIHPLSKIRRHRADGVSKTDTNGWLPRLAKYVTVIPNVST
jgi:hypothetical protein